MKITEMVPLDEIRNAPTVERLRTATPFDIDMRQARMDLETHEFKGRIRALMSDVHSQNGERQRYSGRQRVWPTTDEEAEAQLREKAKNGGPFRTSWSEDAVTRTLSRLDEVRTLLSEVDDEWAILEREYNRRPWARYIAVPGGHIHSGTWCQGGTIRPTTQREWRPALSGVSVADAVTALGPRLCTHCFSDAPTEWKAGAKDDDACDGSGRGEVSGTLRRVGMRHYGECRECHTTQLLTSRGVARKHSKPKEESK